MLKLQELKRSLFGPNPEEIIRFCGWLPLFRDTNKTLQSLPTAVEGHAAGHFCICSLCSPRHLYIYLAIWTDRAFLHDGIQTLDMLSLGFGPKQRSLQLLKAISDTCTVPTKVAGHWGFNGRIRAATWEIRVQFPANARTASF